MASEYSGGRRASSTQILDELESLSQSLNQPHSVNRRTASLALPRSSLPSIPSADEIGSAKKEDKPINRARPRRMSLSPWRSRPKTEEDDPPRERSKTPHRSDARKSDDSEASAEKKGIWNWKPIRALSHIGMNKLSCLLSVEVLSIQNLPASMNGLRLSVCVRKKETKEGAVQTMPSRVSQGYAEFEETLFLKCSVYCNSSQDRQLKFEPRPFTVYVVAVDAEELDFGKNTVDLSQLIQESMEKSYEGTRVRQWDVSFNLRGKARGGELAMKLGFQIMEKDGGIGIYGPGEQSRSSKSSFGRKQSKTSFSVPSPRMSGQKEAWTPTQPEPAPYHLQGMDELNLDEPAPASSSLPSIQKSEEPPKIEDLDLPDFEVVDKGVEILEKESQKEEEGDETSEKSEEEKSASSEVVKEVVVHDPVHLTRLSELDSIAQQIKALESMMGDETITKTEQETETQRLDADEETVTREFLQLLEDEETEEYKSDQPATQDDLHLQDTAPEEGEVNLYLSDLGKGLGCVVQTRDGGYLASTNPMDTEVGRKDAPKLAMQVSKPFVLQMPQPSTGCELFQKMAAIGLDEMSSKLLALMPMEELMGKTAEQIAFEGIASAIIQGRTKEGATSTSSAARIIATVKTMATAMNAGRKERILTGIWNIDEDPMMAEEILAFSMPKIESMVLEALRIQADMAEEEPPFDVSPLSQKPYQKHPLACAIPLEEWMKRNNNGTPPMTLTLMVLVQLRDPLRRYEAVGGPMIAVVHAKRAEAKVEKDGKGKSFKVSSLDVGGLKVSTSGRRHAWDTEKQRLTAMQWLVAYGLGKAVKKGKTSSSKGPDVLWSISSRVMADMWLKSLRNPDVKFAVQ